MTTGERLFAPPDADADRVGARQRALSPRVRSLLQGAADHLAGADPAAAQPALAEALAAAPGQPDVLRLYALLLERMGNHPAAVSNFEAALQAAPDDAVTCAQYARACEDAHDLDRAFALRQRAVGCLPDSPLAWLDLGMHIFKHVDVSSSLAPLERAVQLAPEYAPGWLKLGSACIASGRTTEGATMVRRAIAREPGFGAAWIGLVDIKTVPVTDAEMTEMRSLLAARTGIAETDRTAIEFALGQACERAGLQREAWAHLVHANARRKRELPPWSAGHFRELERHARDAFAGGVRHARETTLGSDVVFIAGPARSGTTLVEQVLAAHPRVQGGDELPTVTQIITEASAARGRQYPAWVPDASADEWQRLGERYLDLTANFRAGRQWSTDKLPNNWRAIGVIRAMLPGAHIVLCRRDPVENCWSCFKQYFLEGWEFTYDIEHLALFWRAFDRAATEWVRRAPASIRAQSYEALTEDPEREIRALLDFLGLPFDAACLHAHAAQRSVRTLSAAQVREPIHRHRSAAAPFGELLDPLRRALGLPVWAELPSRTQTPATSVRDQSSGMAASSGSQRK